VPGTDLLLCVRHYQSDGTLARNFQFVCRDSALKVCTMSGTLLIPFPAEWPRQGGDVAGLCQYFQELCDSRGDFLRVLDLDCQPASRTARLESLIITLVTQTADQVQVHYDVRLSQFQACADRLSEFVFHRSVTGTFAMRGWLFAQYQAQPQRDTCEEF
jgi:hypothetical protein